MKVVHVSYSDAGGGADIAARRLHLALREAGVDSHMLCLYSSGKTPGARGVRRRTRGIGARLAARLRFELRRIQRDPTCGGLSINWLRNAMPARIRALEPDVVHLHWLGMGTLRIEDLPRLPGQLVWTVHDMWPFCGAEHYTFRDTRWREGYTWANRAEQARGLDVNRWVWRRKWRAWQGRTIHTISVSSWMDACVRESRLFRDRPGERVVIG
ncbi:MAG: glycosyl transferase, partial [Verrucomicrobia bacterium]